MHSLTYAVWHALYHSLSLFNSANAEQNCPRSTACWYGGESGGERKETGSVMIIFFFPLGSNKPVDQINRP